jgi:hypothetical protein
MEDEAVEKLLEKYTLGEIEEMKVNIHAMVAPIIEHEFKGFYELEELTAI